MNLLPLTFEIEIKNVFSEKTTTDYGLIFSFILNDKEYALIDNQKGYGYSWTYFKDMLTIGQNKFTGTSFNWDNGFVDIPDMHKPVINNKYLTQDMNIMILNKFKEFNNNSIIIELYEG